jgi:hypothetical protein
VLGSDAQELFGPQQPHQMLGVTTNGLDPVPGRARGMFQGAATAHSAPRFAISRASPYPVRPASYATRAGPGKPAQNAAAVALSLLIPNVCSCPVSISITAAAGQARAERCRRRARGGRI